LFELTPFSASFISVSISFTFDKTPFPLNLKEFESLSSNASREPVEAPDGTAALPFIPDSRNTSASSVGLPLESIISLAYYFFYIGFHFYSFDT
tara:strand:- start:450 stop:731 length:282 start_codon:yes stop_codon:yes gene_type:complete